MWDPKNKTRAAGPLKHDDNSFLRGPLLWLARLLMMVRMVMKKRYSFS